MTSPAWKPGGKKPVSSYPRPKPISAPELSPAGSTSTPIVPPAAETPTAPTVTTATTTTTTVTPSSPSVPWHASLKFRAYIGGWLTLVIGWLVENIATSQFNAGKWTWIALSTSTLLTVRAVVADWMNPAVVAPFAVMNKSNVKP